MEGDLIGRTLELLAIDCWIAAGGRLLTLSGPPGVGKSRLAHEIVRRQPGSLICDLTACRSATDVERALQRALGVSKARLSRALATYDGIVVLDRFEHLVESARGLIEEWMRVPGPRLVVASREPLGVVAETTLALGPLAEADALALYRARAKREIDEPIASSIVARLDRLPLAIELAAARASVLSEADLLARLGRGISAIDSSSLRLRATIAWSIELLRADERATLLACAVFRGPFGGAAAEAVVPQAEGGAVNTIACLVALERKSLLHRVETGTMGGRVALYDAVRDVALEELTRDGGIGEVVRRHGEHYFELAKGVMTATDPLAARALAADVDDLTAAHAFMLERDPIAAATLAIGLDLALGGQTPSGEHVELLSSAIACAERANDPVLRAKALMARARAHRLLGAARRSTRDLRAALVLARGAGAREDEADALRLLGVVARQLSRPLRARTLLEHALALYEDAKLPRGAAIVLDDLGVVAHDLGELATARDFYERALASERIVGDRRFEGITLGHLGLIAHDFHDVEGATVFYREALARHRENGDRRFEGFAQAFLAAAMLERGEIAAAQASVVAATAIDARLGDVDSGALLAGIACAVAATAGKMVEAREALARGRLDLAGRDDEALGRMLDVFGLTLEVAEARRARVEGRHDDERAHHETIRNALAAHEPRSVEERLARRVTSHLLERDAGASAATIVAADGTWFATGPRHVSLGTRRALVLMLAKLAAERRATPGRSTGIEALFEAGWPGERVPEASAKRRVYVGIDTLRALGLRTAIAQRDHGYLLDSSVEIHEVLGQV